MRGAGELGEWLAGRGAGEAAEPFTYVVEHDGLLRVAPRRSEHVVCAGGRPVLAAGEISFARSGDRWVVAGISNQSTGYCPDAACWPEVAGALDRAGLDHPGAFTVEVIFRRCVQCRQVNVVREDFFVCVFCDADLPAEWNVDGGQGVGLNAPRK